MKNSDAAARVRDIAIQISDLVDEARRIAVQHFPRGNALGRYDAYVFDQILEHCEKGNPYNMDLNDLANAIENGEED